MRFRTLHANRWALRIRRAFDRFYQADPQKAIEHANVLLDQASRKEGDRANNLDQPSMIGFMVELAAKAAREQPRLGEPLHLRRR